MPKHQLSTLAREFLDAIHFPGCPFGPSTAPQTSPLPAASYLHTASTSLHSIYFMSFSAFESSLGKESFVLQQVLQYDPEYSTQTLSDSHWKMRVYVLSFNCGHGDWPSA